MPLNMFTREGHRLIGTFATAALLMLTPRAVAAHGPRDPYPDHLPLGHVPPAVDFDEADFVDRLARFSKVTGPWLSEDGRFGDNWQCTDLGAAVSGRRRPKSPAAWLKEPDFVYDVGPGMGEVHRWGDPR